MYSGKVLCIFTLFSVFNINVFNGLFFILSFKWYIGSIIEVLSGFNNILLAVNLFVSLLYLTIKHISLPTVKFFFKNPLLNIVTFINLFEDITLNDK